MRRRSCRRRAAPTGGPGPRRRRPAPSARAGHGPARAWCRTSRRSGPGVGSRRRAERRGRARSCARPRPPRRRVRTPRGPARGGGGRGGRRGRPGRTRRRCAPQQGRSRRDTPGAGDRGGPGPRPTRGPGARGSRGPLPGPSTRVGSRCRVSGIGTRVGEVSTALYRRYRPETFGDVIGQEHVTEPLMQALRTGRVNHAYLFSGPRGCGKTTSARILARCLNCEQGPTPEPCGVCDSCVALARGGAGTVDVIEIDAASHGGVDDARDLRERASYGPAQSRYKVYIIDEAHMVTAQGFNALLKIVEEPPEHVKFIFATTEPDKVIGTIRSRTHHYPFRLVPPAPLHEYMEQLCDEGGRGGGARRALLRGPGRWRLGPRLAVGPRPAHRRVRDRRGSPTSRPPPCSGSPTASCSTPPSRRSRPATRPPSSARSTGSSRPGSTRAASSRTCSSASATSSSSPPCRRARAGCCGTCPRTRWSGCAARPPPSAPARSRGPPTSPTPGSPR